MTAAERTRKWKKLNPDKVRNTNLMWKYGITLEEWKKLFRMQDNKCAICKSSSTNGKNWHTDHDHKTNKVRGILCNLCNLGLGKFKDDPLILENAIAYLNRNTF